MLKGDVSEKISQLERAIKQLDSVKRHLLHNATEIKGQVQSTMSRHLEALRNREVWLLNQVDVVFTSKESVLQAQQARLNKMLGVLHSTVGMATDGNMDAVLADAMQKLDVDMNDLNPEETAFFSFRADAADLRNSILNYGRVDSNGIPMMAAFHEPESQTLPRHFEDYEGPDHHVFHKTVGEADSTVSSRGIYVNIPKLSTRSEDWLLRPTTMTTSADNAPRFSFPSFSGDAFDWMKTKTGKVSPTLRTISSDASIKDWLCQIKNQSEGEDDDFEIVENSAFSTASTDTCPITEVPVRSTSSNLNLTNLDPINLDLPEVVQSWLRSNKEPKKSEPLQFFQNIPSDPDIWLMNQKEKKSCDDCTTTNSSHDIENLGDQLGKLTCRPFMSGFYKSCPTDRRRWLQNTDREREGGMEKREGQKEGVRELPAVTEVCRANELCSGYDECVCNPHCGFQHLGYTDNQFWLVKAAEKDVEVMKEASCFEDCGMEIWLSASRGTESAKTDIVFPYFDEASKETTDWIKGKEKKFDGQLSESSAFNFHHDFADKEIWLTHQKMEMEVPVEESVTWNIVQEQHRKLHPSDWLLSSSSVPSNQLDNKGYWLMA